MFLLFAFLTHFLRENHRRRIHVFWTDRASLYANTPPQLTLRLTLSSDSYAYFAPAIIQGLGHSPVKTQLYSVPPWVVAFGLAMIIATFSDKLRHRYIFVLIPIVVALVGYIILLTVHNRTHLQYGALFLAAAGNYAAMPVIVCWFNSNR
jgi:hypothetical protein